jgi:hypothetical protein
METVHILAGRQVEIRISAFGLLPLAVYQRLFSS